jgi:hypothetical protein
MAKFLSSSAFSTHTCLVESLLNSSNVIYITDPTVENETKMATTGVQTVVELKGKL